VTVYCDGIWRHWGGVMTLTAMVISHRSADLQIASSTGHWFQAANLR
jgi:hypothetical protein